MKRSVLITRRIGLARTPIARGRSGLHTGAIALRGERSRREEDELGAFRAPVRDRANGQGCHQRVHRHEVPDWPRWLKIAPPLRAGREGVPCND